jgi:hypothetical protein
MSFEEIAEARKKRDRKRPLGQVDEGASGRTLRRNLGRGKKSREEELRRPILKFKH